MMRAQWEGFGVEQSRSQSFQSISKASFKKHSLILVLSFIYFLVCLALHIRLGEELSFAFIPYLYAFLLLALPILVVFGIPLQIFAILIRVRPKRPISYIARYYGNALLNTQRWINGGIGIVIMMLAMSSYVGIKSLLKLLVNHNFDELFAKWDRALHGGADPYVWLFKIFDAPSSIVIIDALYFIWFLIMFAFWLLAILSVNETYWRHQFILAFILVWIIGGNLLAAALYSLGPVYYDLVDPHINPFDAQMATLRDIHAEKPLRAIVLQDALRASHILGDGQSLSGISAMPSMHNATSTLFMLAAFKIHKGFGLLMFLFLLSILVGSVLLGWHYAIDSYAGILLAILIWLLADFLLRIQNQFWERREFADTLTDARG